MVLSTKLSAYISLFVRTIESILVLSALAFAVVYFYLYSLTAQKWEPYILTLFLLPILTDGVLLALLFFRKAVKHSNLKFDPSKLTIIIACYNGEKIIGETIENALRQVPPKQILVVSDASTDNTVSVAKSYNVRVHQNVKNVNKAFSISGVMHLVKTPYVLILDDDTLIGETFIPTSLLDEGYTAVAFNVIPVSTQSIINKFQQYEYRKSMFLGKNLRASAGSVGNISGAIGLYRTQDLVKQVDIHSGQFGGEDQQRTTFAHLYGTGKGVTFTESAVYTKVPDSLKSWLRQRSFRWNLSLPELFTTYWQILYKPKFHYLLKIEKAYQMYLLATDPLRMLFFWIFLLHPQLLLTMYLFYITLGICVWLRLKRPVSIWVPLLYPFYGRLESYCRFIAHFYWFKIKHKYIFHHKFHRLVPGRNLKQEYLLVTAFLILLWASAGYQFTNATTKVVAGLKEPEPTPWVSNIVVQIRQPGKAEGNFNEFSQSYDIYVENGDGKSNVARKAILHYINENHLRFHSQVILVAEDSLRYDLTYLGPLYPGEMVNIPRELISKHINLASSYATEKNTL